MLEPGKILILLLLIIGNGILLAKLLKLKFSWDLISIYFIAGMINWILITFIFRFLGFSFIWPIIGLSCLSLIGLYSIKKELQGFKRGKILSDKKYFISHTLFLVLTVLILSTFAFFQGYQKDGSLMIYGENYHDILWHMALSQTLLNDFPVINPIFDQTSLKGYHYLTDFFWSSAHYLTGISLENLLLKWEVWIFAALFGETSFLLFIKIFPKDLTKKILSAFLEVFVGGLAFFVPFILIQASNNPSVFWLDQPGNYVINPQLLLSFSLVNVFITLMIMSKKWWPIMGLILGSLVAIKVYAFLVLGFSFSLIALSNVSRKDFDYFKALVVAAVVSGSILLLTNVSQGNPFLFEPGWFIQTMYTTSDHLNLSDWELRRQVFALHNNYLRLSALWMEGFLVFEFGNFGLKFFALFTIPVVLFLRKKGLVQDWYYLSILMLLVSIILPLLILQKGVPWSSIQFMHYAQLPLCLILITFLSLLGKKKWVFSMLVIIIIGLPTTLLTTVKASDISNYYVISPSRIEGIKKISELPPDSKIFIDHTLQESSIVPAISGRNVYFADPIILDIILVDYSSRVKDLNDLTGLKVNCLGNEYLISVSEDRPKNFAQIYTNDEFTILKCRQ